MKSNKDLGSPTGQEIRRKLGLMGADLFALSIFLYCSEVANGAADDLVPSGDWVNEAPHCTRRLRSSLQGSG